MIERMDHVGVVVDDLAAATELFVEFGLGIVELAETLGGSSTRHRRA